VTRALNLNHASYTFLFLVRNYFSFTCATFHSLFACNFLMSYISKDRDIIDLICCCGTKTIEQVRVKRENDGTNILTSWAHSVVQKKLHQRDILRL
jgi:hypothetical protein